MYGSENWYEGEWYEGQKHGQGQRYYAKGLKYKGQWEYNQKNGHGTMLWSNNDCYQGYWQQNRPHGYGEYTWNLSLNKSFTFLIYNWYKGAWLDGRRNGIGKEIQSNYSFIIFLQFSGRLDAFRIT